MSFAFLLASLLACNTEPPPPAVAPLTADQVAAQVATAFCLSANMAWKDCAAQGATARYGGHEVGFDATVTSFTALPGKTIGMGTAKQDIPGEVQVGFTVTVSVDGRAVLTGPVSHAASDPDLEAARAKVLDEGAQRFVVGQALGLVDALSGQPTSGALASTGLEVPPVELGEGAWRGFASYPVIRGRGLDPDMVKKLAPQVRSVVRAVEPLLEGLPPQVHVVKVDAKLGGGGGPGPCGIVPPVVVTTGASVSIVPLAGTVSVDGTPLPDGEKPAICALSESVAWPLPQGGAVMEWTQIVAVAPVPAGG